MWLYGSCARGQPPRPEADVDVLVIAPGSSWDNLGLGHAYRLLHQLATEEGVNPMLFSLQVFDEEWLAGRRAIDSFIQEVDRDKVVLAGQP